MPVGVGFQRAWIRRPLEAAALDPKPSRLDGALDQLAAVGEVVSPHREGAERRDDEELRPAREALEIDEELSGDEEVQGMERHREDAARRLVDRAGVSGRKDDEPLRPELDGSRDRCVVGDAPVDEMELPDPHRREDRGYCGTREQGLDGRPG